MLCVKDGLGQSLRITETQVYTLTGERVDGVGGIANKRQPWFNVLLGMPSLDGETGPQPTLNNRTEFILEGRFKLGALVSSHRRWASLGVVLQTMALWLSELWLSVIGKKAKGPVGKKRCQAVF